MFVLGQKLQFLGAQCSCYCFIIIMSLVFSICFLLLMSPTSSLYQGLYFEEKTRLGSTPPSCHNKCNGCHPCMAVQVPSPLPTGSSKAMTNSMELFDPSAANRFSNYKPLGWKCHCNDHFYNP